MGEISVTPIITIIWVVFCVGFCMSYGYGYDSKKTAKTWLLEQRREDGSWGENTPRAVIALYFTDKDFFSPKNKEGEIIAKQLEIQLAIDLLEKPVWLETNQLAMYINALTASCRNPRNFYGVNLVDRLKTKLNDADVSTAVVALYNAKEDNPFNLIRQVPHSMRVDTQSTYWADSFALGLMALSCAEDTASIEEWIDSYVDNLVASQKEDGSFGNLYTTALVMQALNAVAKEDYDKRAAKDFLKSHEKDGSYGDLVSTYLVLPVLQDSSLASLREVSCPEAVDPKIALPTAQTKINMLYTLAFGNGNDVQYVMQLSVPSHISFFDVMTIAADRDPRFEFLATNFTDGIQVYSISGKANDPEKRLYWHLLKNTRATGDRRAVLQHSSVTTEFPEEGNHYIFWYKS